MKTRLCNVAIGQFFRLPGSRTVFEHRGNGWHQVYGRSETGGPWHVSSDTVVDCNSIQTVRFWVYHSCGHTPGWVRITLTAERPEARFYHGHKHEEGYSQEWNSYELDGEKVVWVCTTEGRDCDGRSGTGQCWECDNNDLASVAPESDEYGDRPARPNWCDQGSRMYDQYAEMAGY